MSRFPDMKKSLTSATNYMALLDNQKVSTVDTFSTEAMKL